MVDTVCDIKCHTNAYRDCRGHGRFERTIERCAYGTWSSRSAAQMELKKLLYSIRLPSTQGIRIYCVFLKIISWTKFTSQITTGPGWSF